MQENLQTPVNGETPNRMVETIYCPRDGQKVSVIFETSTGLLPKRTGVALCPKDSYSESLDPPLGGNTCELRCLSPVGGRPFY